MRNAPIHDAVERGATTEVVRLLDSDPTLVHAKGLDGGRPLHFCRSVELAAVLVDRGAELDAVDDDHGSTPAQWRIGDAPDVARFLIDRGASPDIFLAAALGDLELTRRVVQEQPDCTSYRIGHNSGPFPGIGHRGRGGTILQWTLGFNRSPHEVALQRGHHGLFHYLVEHTPIPKRLVIACMIPDRSAAERIVHEHPDVVQVLEHEDLQMLAKVCWETNKDIEAARLMLDLGFPPDVPEENHGFSALHNAAWCGDPELVALLLERGHPVHLRDPGYHSTAIGWAIHSCLEARRHPEGDFPRVIELLVDAGVPIDAGQEATGHEGIDAMIRPRHRR